MGAGKGKGANDMERQQISQKGSSKRSHQASEDKRQNTKLVWDIVIFTEYPSEHFLNSWLYWFFSLPKKMQMSCYSPVYT